MLACKATILEMFWISLENQKYPPIHSCKLSKLPGLLTNDPLLFSFFFLPPYAAWHESWVFTKQVACTFGSSAHCCKRPWADLHSKARLRQRELIQKQTMDHCSSHNKHLARDTANRPRSSTGSLPLPPARLTTQLNNLSWGNNKWKNLLKKTKTFNVVMRNI